jgi:hypothetical protein
LQDSQNNPNDLLQQLLDGPVAWDDAQFPLHVTFDALVDHTLFDEGVEGFLSDSCTRGVSTHGDAAALTKSLSSPEDSNIFNETPQNPLVSVSDSNAVHQLGENRSPSDDFTESVGLLVFPSVSSASSSRPDTVLPSQYLFPQVRQPWFTFSQPSLGSYECRTDFLLPDIDDACADATPTCSGLESYLVPLPHLYLPATLPTSSTGAHVAELPYTPSNLLSHSSTLPSPCPPLSDFSSNFSPTPDLRTPNASQLISAPVNVDRNVLRAAGVASGASRPLRASPASPPSLRCPFDDCDFSCRRQLELAVHQSTEHKFPCLRGCPRSFTTSRRRDDHHQSGHRQPQSTAPHYQCGCGMTVVATRRDNHLRHLRGCRRRGTTPYICRCGHLPTTDREEHMRHLTNCMDRAGRPRGS